MDEFRTYSGEIVGYFGMNTPKGCTYKGTHLMPVRLWASSVKVVSCGMSPNTSVELHYCPHPNWMAKA